MKRLVLLAFFVVPLLSLAQQPPKVILHLQSTDTLVHKSIVNQFGNLKKEFPTAEIELVCHGPGLDFLLKSKARYVNKLDNLKLTNVSYVGCEYTMSQKNIKREDLVPFASTVPYGLAEIIKKQQADWIYVKLGF